LSAVFYSSSVNGSVNGEEKREVCAPPKTPEKEVTILITLKLLTKSDLRCATQFPIKSNAKEFDLFDDRNLNPVYCERNEEIRNLFLENIIDLDLLGERTKSREARNLRIDSRERERESLAEEIESSEKKNNSVCILENV